MSASHRYAFPAACAALLLALLAAYANHFHNSFHFDDSHTIENNQYIRDWRNIPRFFADPRTFSALPTNQSYRPLLTATLAVDYALAGGLNTRWFHIDSFALLLLQCAVLIALFTRLLGSRWLALFGAALYGLHGALAETVNYIIARGDMLSTLGATASIWLFARGGRTRRFHLYLIPMALAALAKEQGAMAAPLLFLYVGLFELKWSIPEMLRPRSFLSLLRASLPALAVCIGLSVLAVKIATSFSPGGTSRWEYLATQPYVLFRYLTTFIFPAGLSADTDWAPVRSVEDGRLWLGLLFVAAMVALAVRSSRRETERPIAYGILWFFIALLPTSSLIPLSEVTNDHRLYFPYVGLSLAASCALGLWLKANQSLPRAVPVAACLVLLVAHAAAAHARNEVWRTEETLWKDVTEKSPGNGRAWMNYGITRMAKGDLDEAERCFRRGLEIYPNYGYLHTNLAVAEAARGHNDVAEREFRLGMTLMPRVPSLRYFYARWLEGQKRWAEAAPLLRETLAMSPADSPARSLLLTTLAKQRDWPALEAAAREALQLRQGDPEALRYLQMAQQRPAQSTADPAATADDNLRLSLMFYNLGKWQSSIEASDKALALQPEFPEALNNKCAALNQLRRHGEAVTACEAALRLKPDFPLARNNLAAAKAAIR